MQKEKYIIHCFTAPEHIRKEERTNKLFKAIQIKKKLQEEYPESFCNIGKIPFKDRYPNFPIWFSLISLFLVKNSSDVEWCIRRILQVMQLWK